MRQPEPLDHATLVAPLVGLGLTFKIRRVLELGAGYNSTPLFLNRDAFREVIELVSLEDDPEWLQRVKERIGNDPRVTFVDAIPDNLDRFDLILIDSATSPKRVAAIQHVLARVKSAIVVVHDSETLLYQEELKKFPYLCEVFGYDPETAFAWNKWGAPQFKIHAVADLVLQRAASLRPDDVVGWISAFKDKTPEVGRKTVSITMTAYDRAHLLKNTLDSIVIQTRQPEQIVIVEDGWDGGKTETICAQYKAAGLPIEYFCRRNRPNRGFSNPAIPKNIGIKLCRGEIIIIQGAEVRYAASTDIANLVAPVETDPDLSTFATCQALNENGGFLMWYGDPAFENYLGFCHAIRKDRIVAIGGFDEGYIGYGYEDDDFSWRMRASGVVYRWATDVLVLHQWHPGHPNPDDAEIEKQSKEYGGRAIEDYYKKKTRGLEANVGRNWGDPKS